MKQNLPDIIKENKKLQQALLAQEGGIMKYFVNHLDVNGTAALFGDYQDYCVQEFFEKNKWDSRNIWAGDEMERAALGYEHLMKELLCQAALKPLLADLPKDIYEKVIQFIEQYLDYAYVQNRHRWHPNGISGRTLYQEVIDLYRPGGLAFKCMEFILKEHHANGQIEKTYSDLYDEFLIRQYVAHLNSGVFPQLRQVVADMLEGKSEVECCRMAIDTLMKVRGFSQLIYNEGWVQYLRDVKYPADDKAYFDETGKHLNIDRYMEGAELRESDGKWLRDVMQQVISEALTYKNSSNSMRVFFANFVSLLNDVGRIWAARLLAKHDVDMHELEIQACCVLQPYNKNNYYVDKHFTDVGPDQYCISAPVQAQAFLARIRTNSDINVEAPWDASLDHVFDSRLNPQAIYVALKNVTLPQMKDYYPRFFVYFRVLDYLGWLCKKPQAKFLKWANLHWQCGWDVNDASKFKFSNSIKKELRYAPLPNWYAYTVPGSDIGKYYRILAEGVINQLTDTVNDEYLKDKTKFYKEGVKDFINQGNTIEHPYPSTV